MALTSIGDQGRMFLARTMVTQLRTRVDRSAAEMSTGMKQDLRSPVAGDLRHVLSLRREQRLLDSFKLAASEASMLAQTAQSALESISSTVHGVASGIVLSAQSAQSAQMETAAGAARTALGAVVAALNSAIAGVAPFSGTRSDGAALMGVDAILASLSAATAGEVTVSGMAAAIDAWLGPGGEYETTAFQGEAEPLSFRLGPNESVSLGATALNPEIRTLIGGLALAALSGQLSADPAAQASALEMASGRLGAGDGGLVAVRARVGLVEAKVDARLTEVATRQDSLRLSELRLTAVDPFDAATTLEEDANRLDAVYAVTARLSRLSLLGHLS